MDHGDMGGSEPMCSMNVSYTPPASCAPLSIYQPAQPQKQMLFTWDTTNLCIVFPSWRVTGTFSLIWSLIAACAAGCASAAIAMSATIAPRPAMPPLESDRVSGRLLRKV